MDDKQIGICEECRATFFEKDLIPDGKWAHVCKEKKFKEEHRCESYIVKYKLAEQ